MDTSGMHIVGVRIGLILRSKCLKLWREFCCRCCFKNVDNDFFKRLLLLGCSQISVQNCEVISGTVSRVLNLLSFLFLNSAAYSQAWFKLNGIPNFQLHWVHSSPSMYFEAFFLWELFRCASFSGSHYCETQWAGAPWWVIVSAWPTWSVWSLFGWVKTVSLDTQFWIFRIVASHGA